MITSMTESFFSLAGVIVGALITNFGVVYQNRAIQKSEKFNVYADFLTNINKGFRLLEDINRIQSTSKKISQKTKKAQNLKDIKRIESETHEVDVQIKKLQNKLEVFLSGMDSALSKYQLIAPAYLVKYGISLRNGIDECADGKIELTELRKRYQHFVLASRFSMYGKIIGKISDRYLQKRDAEN